jgi:peptidoglycan/xylan/chitin deacetylase (PgdA/CDA1 family)
MPLSSRLAALLVLAVSALWAAEPAAPVPAAPAANGALPLIMLKLDDLTKVTPRWQRLVDFLEAEGIHCSIGIIGDALEKEDPILAEWVKSRQAKGTVEFWNHGYVSAFAKDAVKKGEFVGTGYEAQLKELKRSQELARQRFGFDFLSFGPHDSGTDADTYLALEQIPELKIIWFYGPKAPSTTSKIVIERRIELEVPIFVPNPGAVKDRFEKNGRTRDYLAMQGHANMWDDARFAAFQQAVRYLKEQGCRFVTASEWLASRK